MKIETSKLKGKALDWAVAVAVGTQYDVGADEDWNPDYSTNWLLGGQVLDVHDISVWLTFGNLKERGKWSACMPDWFDLLSPDVEPHPEAAYGDTQLEAGMRALVRDKLGDEVEVPDELA